MATPMVAGAAARVLSATPALTNAQVAAQLVATGIDLSASIGVPVDQDGNGIDVGDPECWPTGNSTSMTDADVAAAMGRGEVLGMAFDAVSGTPLNGAKVTALLGKKAQGFGGVVDNAGDETYRIVNLPLGNSYTFKIQKPKYTSGSQAFLSATLGAESSNLPSISVPTSKNWFVVTDWEDGSFSGPELDEYAFTPMLSPAPCWVGFNGLCGSGSLTTAPFMRWLFDGGPSVDPANVSDGIAGGQASSLLDDGRVEGNAGRHAHGQNALEACHRRHLQRVGVAIDRRERTRCSVDDR